MVAEAVSRVHGLGPSDTNITFTPVTTYFILCIRLPVNMSGVKSLYRKHAAKCYLCVSIIPRRSESPITTTEYGRTLWFILVLDALLQASVADRGKLHYLPLLWRSRSNKKLTWKWVVCSRVYNILSTRSFKIFVIYVIYFVVDSTQVSTMRNLLINVLIFGEGCLICYSNYYPKFPMICGFKC